MEFRSQAKPFTDFDANRYIGYPHSNGFADSGQSLVVGQLESSAVSLWKMDRASLSSVHLGTFPISEPPPNKVIWFDVAADANQMIASANQSILQWDLNRIGPPIEVYRAEAPWLLDQLLSITADARQMVVSIRHRDHGVSRGVLVNLSTGKAETIIEVPWFANHFHFCPADPNWIGFAHEGPTEKIPDRTCVWHAMHAPQGRCVFDQASDDPATHLCVGHERWTHHDVSALTIGYGVSPAGPRGLYEVFADGRPARLISGGDRDFHCDVSRDGRFAVIDTTGPHDAPGKGWENAQDVSDIFIVDMTTGRRQFLARSHLNLHPRHAHPVFTPDASMIFYNEAESGGDRNRIMQVPNPWK
jgi:hypothetical protein